MAGWTAERLAIATLPDIFLAMQGRYWLIQFWETLGPTFMRTSVVWGTDPQNLTNVTFFDKLLP
jgi:hypothetical protein